MKRILTACLTLAALISPAAAVQAADYLISSTQVVEHPALDAVRNGFQDYLKENGVEAEYKVYTAQGSMDMAIQIASQIRDDDPDLILAIATPTAQAVAQKLHNKPILISAVTDPVAAGLVDNMEKPGGNISGMTDKSPVDRQMALIKEIVPGVETIGVLYNAGEANSVVSYNMIEEECAKLGIEVEPRTVSTSAEVYSAAKSLVGRVDAITIPTDNTVISALESAVKICEEADIPLFAADTDSVERGVVASIAIDYYRMGRQTGEMARRILVEGADPGQMPVETLKDLKLYVNTSAAAKMGVDLPGDVIDRADTVIE
ncbi:ABC transporter substrate-binding protein [Desulfohalovibrio reitneri]|uniref:ABC transporter substrate-binding protein n=1 Tax=Desulfohalovibrio reitneri TaxID=1307759 RepID=UPI0004A70C47|nr:ABC transporter substrate-binding protein [Desulfohalovibrio reitneri]